MNVKNLIGVVLLLCIASAGAQTADTVDSKYEGYLLAEVLESVSARIGKSIFLDPQVKQHDRVVVFGKSVTELEFADMLRILDLHGYTAYEVDDALNVVKENSVRSDSLPTFMEGQSYEPLQYVSKVVALNKLCAAQALPILRPLVARNAHLTAMTQGNSLIMVDKYANIQRVENIIKELDNSIDKKQKCEPLPKKS